MDKIKTTLLKIVGRIKKMTGLYLALAMMTIPLALVVKIEAPSTPMWLIYSLLIIGTLSLIGSVVFTVKDEREKRKETASIFFIANSIHNDITTLVNEIRRDKNDRDKKPD